MSRETKIGILSVVVVLIMVWGYMFLKGKNLLSKSKSFYTLYDDVTDLNISSPVLLNGFKVGTVTEIELNPDNVKQMIVRYDIEGEYKIPDNAEAILKPFGFMGGKVISIEFEKVCDGANCAKNKSNIKGRSIGLVDSMLGEGEIDKYSSGLVESAKTIVANIGKEGEPGPVNESVRQLEIITKNLAALSLSSNQLIQANSRNVELTMQNIAKITQGLAKNNENIEHIINNLDKITGDLAKSNVNQSVVKINETMDAAKSALQGTTKTIENLQGILTAVEKGNGTLSKLIYDENLYKNFNTTSREINLLLQDLRLNPKRYAHFSVFGKKQKDYTLPEKDPAKDE